MVLIALVAWAAIAAVGHETSEEFEVIAASLSTEGSHSGLGGNPGSDEAEDTENDEDSQDGAGNEDEDNDADLQGSDPEDSDPGNDNDGNGNGQGNGNGNGQGNGNGNPGNGNGNGNGSGQGNGNGNGQGNGNPEGESNNPPSDAGGGNPSDNQESYPELDDSGRPQDVSVNPGVAEFTKINKPKNNGKWNATFELSNDSDHDMYVTVEVRVMSDKKTDTKLVEVRIPARGTATHVVKDNHYKDNPSGTSEDRVEISVIRVRNGANGASVNTTGPTAHLDVPRP